MERLNSRKSELEGQLADAAIYADANKDKPQAGPVRTGTDHQGTGTIGGGMAGTTGRPGSHFRLNVISLSNFHLKPPQYTD
jgi:hypothetical protein